MRRKKESSLRERALRMLARREHSRLELQRKLAPHVAESDDIQGLLDDLETRGWLSEKRVVEQTVHTRRGRYGVVRIIRELREKGVSEEAISAAKSQVRESELEAARAVWRKKFGKLPKSASERGKQIRFMQGRGFDLDVILKLLRGAGEDE
ncbi:MAG TPA: recombination regulator RecX [Burkholderiales bacterium]|nr:recombination regulator RecX [Burkholderiales bacterium]